MNQPPPDRPWAKPKEYRIVPWAHEDMQGIIDLFKASGQKFFTDPRDYRNQYTLLAKDDNGKIVAVLTGRITAELMLTVEPNAVAPLRMLAAIYSLWGKMRAVLWGHGIADLHAPIYKENKTFYEILRRVGFVEDDRLHLTYDVRKAMENGK